MVKDLFFVFWFFAPAGVANLFAFFSGKIPFLKPFTYPVDCYMKLNGKRVLGSHKTIRGFIVGIFASIVTVYSEIFLFTSMPFLRDILPLDYTTINPVLLGFLAGFGALAGDALKSFFKRQMAIAPGVSWIPFDQIDYIIGGIICTWFYLPLTFLQYILLILVWVFLHPAISLFGYILKLKKEPL